MRPNLADVANRVGILEKGFGEMQTALNTHSEATISAAKLLDIRLLEIETGQREILDVVKTTKSVSRFVRRWASPIIASAATAGFFNPKVSAFLMSLFA